MTGYGGFGDDDELLSSEFFESDLKTYFEIKNVEVKEYDIVQLKGSPHKGDILGMLPDDTVYIYWDHHKNRTIEQMKDIVWIKIIHDKSNKVWRRTDGSQDFS